MPNHQQFDPNDPTLPANLPPDLRRIDSHLKDDGRLWQTHLPSDEPLAWQARALAYGGPTAANPSAPRGTTSPHRGLPVRTLIAAASALVVVALLATLFFVLAPYRGQQTKPLIAKTATPTATSGPTSTPTPPPIPLSVYFGSMGPNGNCCGSVYALDASNGQVRWKHQLKSDVYAVIVSGSVVYAGTFDRQLYALDARDGTELWHIATHYVINPFILANGVIYTGSMGDSQTHSFVDAYRASDGKRLWEYDGGNCGNVTVLAADDNALYTMSCGGNPGAVQAFHALDGAPLWHTPITNLTDEGTLVTGVLYLNAFGDVYAIRVRDGFQLWHIHLPNNGSEGGFAPSVMNGVVYDTTNTDVYALRADNGAQLWDIRLPPGPGLLNVILAADGAVFVPVGGTLYALRPGDGSQLWHISNAGEYTQPVATASAIYIILGPGSSPSTQYTVYALSPNDGTTIWKYSGNDDGSNITVG